MEFDPTYDYGQTDLTNEKNLAYWNFVQLIKTLITLSSSTEEQAEIIGYGAVCDEMAMDFELYFTVAVDQYKNFNLLSFSQLERLNELDLFFDNKSGEKSPDFWDDLLPETNQEWEIVRQMAKDILKLLKMEDLKLAFTREERFEETNQEKKIIMQSTKIFLVK